MIYLQTAYQIKFHKQKGKGAFNSADQQKETNNTSDYHNQTFKNYQV